MQEGSDLPFQLKAKVNVVERLGDASYLYLENGENNPLCIKTDGHSTTRSGDTVKFSADFSAVHVFDSLGNALTRTTTDERYRAPKLSA